MKDDEYLGHNAYRIRFDNRFIGMSENALPYYKVSPNIIVKYDPSMYFNHDLYIARKYPGQATAYKDHTPTEYKEHGGFVSTTAPDSAFRMPTDAKPVSCYWVSGSNIEPYYGQSNYDVISMSGSMPNGGWEYITYPHFSAQLTDFSHVDMTTWGSGTCEIFRFNAPCATNLTLLANNSNYTALRNFYCPNVTAMNSAFTVINWGPAPSPQISHNIYEIENFYAPNVYEGASAITTSNLTSVKNACVGAGLGQWFQGGQGGIGHNANIYLTNYTACYWNPQTNPVFNGYNGTTGSGSIHLNGDIVLNVTGIDDFLLTYFRKCTFGDQSATNVYLGPKDQAIYENDSFGRRTCLDCTFGTYPVKFYTCFQP
jgi:hypothetical protein